MKHVLLPPLPTGIDRHVSGRATEDREDRFISTFSGQPRDRRRHAQLVRGRLDHAGRALGGLPVE